MQFLALEGLLDRGLKIRPMTLPDRFIDQDTPDRMYEAAGLDAKSIVAPHSTRLAAKTKQPPRCAPDACPRHAALRHFGTCGGCAFQDLSDEAYRAMKRETVAETLAAQGLSNTVVAEIVESAPSTRRRAAFKVEKIGGKTAIGFHAARSHTIVDLHECRVMTPALTALVPACAR